MRPEIKELFQKCLHQDVFIVGGGPSLRDFDFSRLDGKVTIGLNSSFMKLPNATALYWADEPWAARNHDSLLKHQCKLRFHARFHINEDTLHTKKGTAGAYFLRRMGKTGIDTDKNNVCGTNSGAHALNLIVNMRPARIILLGYDMKNTKHSHWHDLNPTFPNSRIYTEDFIPCLESMAGPIAELGIPVINCSMESALMCFEKDTIENYLESV